MLLLLTFPVWIRASNVSRPYDEKRERNEERTAESGVFRLATVKSNSQIGFIGNDDDLSGLFKLVGPDTYHFAGSAAETIFYSVAKGRVPSLHSTDPRILWGSDLSPPVTFA